MSFLRWPTDPAEATRRGLRSFDRVAPRYDLMRVLVSGGREQAWKRRALGAALAADVTCCLDVATGTGDLAALIRERVPDATVVGVDGHRGMLALARRKAAAAGTRWVLADLNRLPFPAGRFDAVTVGYGLRYATDLPGFLQACADVLRPGGLFWSFDLGRPPSAVVRGIWMGYLFATGTLLGTILHGRPATYWHLVETLRAYPGQDAVAELLRCAGFAEVGCENLMGGALAVHVARKGDS